MNITRKSFFGKLAALVAVPFAAPHAVSALVAEVKERKVLEQSKVETKKLNDFYTEPDIGTFQFSGVMPRYVTGICSISGRFW